MKLNRINSLFWHLLITPLSGLLYFPINRYIILPRLGNGEPYVDIDGNLIEQYFSANQAALIAAVLAEAVTVYFTVRTFKKLTERWQKTAYFIFCILFSLLTMVLFLEFSLWS